LVTYCIGTVLRNMLLKIKKKVKRRSVSSVRIVTCYGRTVRGSNRGGGEISPHPSRPVLRPIQPPIQWVKRPGSGANHPHPSSAEVKERVELYVYSPCGPLWPVPGRTLIFKLFDKEGSSVKTHWKRGLLE
jgi:hypothetical protein